jgi:hypothetical protein
LRQVCCPNKDNAADHDSNGDQSKARGTIHLGNGFVAVAANRNQIEQRLTAKVPVRQMMRLRRAPHAIVINSSLTLIMIAL